MASSGTRWVGLLALGLACVAGCSAQAGQDDAEGSVSSTGQQAIVEGTPEAIGVLELLNDPATDLHVLDVLVPLDKRAAENLIAHRNGPEGAFDDIAEVDAVPYVGASALANLVAYAEANGYVPSGGDLLGVFDNVAFTVDEATETLAFVNTASETTLDDEVGLDRRAVDSILAARTIESMLELQSLHYVGQSAMLKLRDFPKPATTGSLPEGSECDAHAECQTGLCSGLLTNFLDHGFCMEPWTANTFESTTSLAIADGGASVSSTLSVSGLASVPLDVVVDLEIDHPRPEDLVVVLHQPGGASAVLWNHQANPPSQIVAPNGIEGDNMVNGDWVLEITDTVAGQSGTLKSWKMWLSSNWD
jgi:hypothetical protein